MARAQAAVAWNFEGRAFVAVASTPGITETTLNAFFLRLPLSAFLPPIQPRC